MGSLQISQQMDFKRISLSLHLNPRGQTVGGPVISRVCRTFCPYESIFHKYPCGLSEEWIMKAPEPVYYFPRNAFLIKNVNSFRAKIKIHTPKEITVNMKSFKTMNLKNYNKHLQNEFLKGTIARISKVVL